MEYYNGQLCISYDELTGGDHPLVKAGTLKTWQTRCKIRQERKAYGEGVTALFAYESLPNAIRMEFEHRYGDPSKLLPKPGERYYVEDVAARTYYETYKYQKNGKEVYLPQRIIEEYTTNASICNMLIDRWGELTALSNKLGNRRRDLWRVLSEYAESLRYAHKHTLPRSEGRLRSKVMEYKSEGYLTLISGKMGNSNTAKITEEAGLYLLGLRRNRSEVLTNSQLLEEYNKHSKQKGFKPITLATLTAWLNEPSIRPLWLDVDQGEVAANKELTRLQRTEMPTLRNSVWEGDGTRLNLYYNKGGKLATVDVYMVIDVATKMWLGWSFGEGETFEMARQAFRKALERSGERPYQIKTDNQGSLVGARGKKLIEEIALIRSNSTPYRSSSKMIERELGELQRTELHRYPNFTGQNVTTGKRPNIEWLHANMDQVPDYKGMIEQFESAVDRWNNTIVPKYGKSRSDLYAERINDELTPVGRMDYIRIFWKYHDHTNLYTQSGITIKVDKREYTYEVLDDRGLPDIEWLLEHTGERYQVCYNPDNMREACLYAIDKDGGLRFERELSPYLRIVRAIQEQSYEESRLAHILVHMDKEMRIQRVARCRAIDYLFGREYKQPRVAGLSASENEKIERIAQELYERYKEKVRLPQGPIVIEQPVEVIPPKEEILVVPTISPRRYSLGQTLKEESKLEWMDVLANGPRDKRAGNIEKY